MDNATQNQIINNTIDREGGSQHVTTDHGNVIVNDHAAVGTNHGLTYAYMHDLAGRETYADGTPNLHFGISTDYQSMNAYIGNLSTTDAAAIYSHQIAHQVGLQQIDNGRVGELIFDQAIVGGPTAANNTVQATLAINGAEVNIDGHGGPQTISAINAQNPNVLASQLYDARDTINQSNGQHQPEFAQGWDNRLESIGRAELSPAERTAYENSFTISQFQTYLNEHSGQTVANDGIWGNQTATALATIQNGQGHIIQPETRADFVQWSFQKELTLYTENYKDSLWVTQNDPEKAQAIATDKYYESLPGNHSPATAEQKEARIVEHIDGKYGPAAVQAFHEVRQNENREIQQHHYDQSHSNQNQIDHSYQH